MSSEPLADGRDCPACRLGGTLTLGTTSQADLIDEQTVVIHGVPTLVCDRCGVEVFDETTSRVLEGAFSRAARNHARTFVIDFIDIQPEAAAM